MQKVWHRPALDFWMQSNKRQARSPFTIGKHLSRPLAGPNIKSGLIIPCQHWGNSIYTHHLIIIYSSDLTQRMQDSHFHKSKTTNNMICLNTSGGLGSGYLTVLLENGDWIKINQDTAVFMENCETYTWLEQQGYLHLLCVVRHSPSLAVWCPSWTSQRALEGELKSIPERLFSSVLLVFTSFRSWSLSCLMSFTARSRSEPAFTSFTFSSSRSLTLASSSRIFASFLSFKICLWHIYGKE